MTESSTSSPTSAPMSTLEPTLTSTLEPASSYEKEVSQLPDCCHFCSSMIPDNLINRQRTVQICQNRDCEYKSRSVYLGDTFIQDYLKYRPDVMRFIYDCALQSIKDPRYEKLFTPVPYFEEMTLHELREHLLKCRNLIYLINGDDSEMEIGRAHV